MRTLQVARRERRESVEQQLANLERWGIRLRAGLNPQTLVREYGRRYLESTPYVRLLTVLGEVDPGNGVPNSPDLCYLHAGSVRGPACYVRVVERLRDISSGQLALEEIDHEAEPDGSVVRVRIRVDAHLHVWAFQLREHGWDRSLLERVAKLQIALGAERCYTVADLGTEGCLVGCFTGPQLYLLRNGTGLGWRWLG